LETWIFQAFSPRIALVKPPVKSARREQFVVRSGFAQFAVMKNHNAVAFLNRRKPVRDNQGRSLLHYAVNRLLN
jgi:hypothetical protein